MQKGYWTAEVAEMLGVASVTIRKWASLFEEKGYRFATDEHGRRGFTEADVLMFRHYIELTQSKSMNQNAAIEVCIVRHPETSVQLRTPTDTSLAALIERYESRYDEIIGALQKIIDQNERLQERLNKQEQFIEESLKRRDEELTGVLRTMLEAAAAQNNQPKRKWWPFGRK